jgi:hypothetical protein
MLTGLNGTRTMTPIEQLDEMIRLRATRSPAIVQMREWKAEIERLTDEVASKSEQIGKLYKVCNERDVLKNALASLAYFEVENLGSEAVSGRPAKYFECKLCGDWNDTKLHIEHADSCPLSSQLRG